MAVSANPVPEKILADLRPYLGKFHPDLWKEKEKVAAKPVPTRLEYSFTEKAGGLQATLAVIRQGTVSYSRRDFSAPSDKQLLVNESWSLKAEDAEKLLDALLAGALLDVPDTGGDKFPNHLVQVWAGRWRTSLHPKEMPEGAMKHLRPLLEKADPAVWKKK